MSKKLSTGSVEMIRNIFLLHPFVVIFSDSQKPNSHVVLVAPVAARVGLRAVFAAIRRKEFHEFSASVA
jgi:hypothetical protein